MTSITLTLTGNKSKLSADYFPPIDLSDGHFVCGLVDFETFNCIPNIDETNNKFYYNSPHTVTFKKDGFDEKSIENDDELVIESIVYDNGNNIITVNFEEKCITIPTGSYEIEDINNYLINALKAENISLSIQENKNTLKSEIKCSSRINFTHNNSIGSLLGFDKCVLEPNLTHTSKQPVNITKVNAIRIECNITTGAYINNKLVHTIHEFYPTSSPGYKIVEVPKNVIYLPVTVRKIHNLSINILDQNDNIINFRGETITLRIHIKEDR